MFLFLSGRASSFNPEFEIASGIFFFFSFAIAIAEDVSGFLICGTTTTDLSESAVLFCVFEMAPTSGFLICCLLFSTTATLFWLLVMGGLLFFVTGMDFCNSFPVLASGFLICCLLLSITATLFWLFSGAGKL